MASASTTAGPSSSPYIPDSGIASSAGVGLGTRLPSLPPPPSAVSKEPGPAYGSNEWRYEMRREAQVIIPGLYLGPFQASSNLLRLKEQGITHILCVRDSREARFIYPRFPTEFRYMTLDIVDNAPCTVPGTASVFDGMLIDRSEQDQNLITLFPGSRDFIEEALNMGGNVLVHCNGGIALSPAIVVGYLMWKFNWTSEAALMYIQTKRYCASPRSFSNQLKEYEPVYMAQKMMAVDNRPSLGGNKRQASDEMEAEEHSVKRTPNGSEPIADIAMD